uniref:Isoleucine--tRNA ligase, cytoplasmic n=1 Tax=Sinocyclocheilus rhinocerous TaxID=307959 RepID=A0A673ME19_9TELE
MVEVVPESIHFPSEEERILQLWLDKDCFQECLKQSKNRPRFTFYDGPPFATGLPHYGHILAGTIKDIVTRFAHQNGFHVERRFGWDCHGLPVEYEIDKALNIRGPEDVAKMGIAEYNKQCRSIVMRYANEWETSVRRMGRWIDFRNDYKTLYPWFMETVWWVFKQLYEKGLVYRGVKVMPFSTACNTPLSNFEAHQNYKDVQDPSVIVTFPLLEDETVSFLAWTTTPWTLPSNLALCVSPDFIYVKVKGALHLSITIVLGMHRNEMCFCLYRFPGKTLKGKKYKPLFEYFIKCKESGAFSVVVDNYVRDDDGTGVVHQAPYFGADDYRVCMDYKIIQRDSAPICPVDSSGVFTAEVTHFAGQYVKDADKNIIKWLKENGRLVSSSSFKHSYPFCWRSDTPLIYKAVPSWFVRVEHMVEKLLDNNSKCYWVPEFVREKRFGNWLRDARDWAVSRNRYWGTPIPLWVSDDYEEVVCVGSTAELEELTGAKVSDLHRESIDGLTILSRCGKGQLKRVSEVFDCWFESGSMPYAQVHYPFENRREFEDAFPADFIAEGIDQTRGWFYTLLVLSTALFGKPPFKNVIVNGLVLASDGQKMSKRKKNYPDPSLIVQSYGADALRLYLINSPVVRAENLRFKEEGVRDVLKDVLLPWYNAYRFLVQNIQRLQKEAAVEFLYNESTVSVSDNIMDKWIQSFTQSLIQFFRDEMGAYRLYTVVPKLVKFVDMLTNWYVRTNRRRLKGESGTEDCMRALETLFSVLFSMCRLMAPFTPFITELMYQNLCHLIDPASVEEKDTASIHYLMLPHVRESLIDKRIESAVSQMQSVIELGRVIRDRKTLPVKYPLKEVLVIHQDPEALRDIQSLQKYILEELNVRQLTLSTDKDKYGIRLRAEPDHMVLGKRLKGAFKSVTASIKELKSAELEIFQRTGSIVVDGHELHEDDLRLMYSFDQTSGTPSQYEAHSDAQVLVLLDVTPDQSMQDEGVAREVINRIQKLRKKGHLVPSDEITVYYSSQPAGEYLDKVIQAHTDFILATTKAPLKPYPVAQNASVIVQEKTQLKGSDLEITIVRGSSVSRALLTTAACAYVNLRVTLKDRQQGTSPAGMFLKGFEGKHEGAGAFSHVCLSLSALNAETDLMSLSGKTLTVTSGSSPADASSSDSLLCPYVNLQLMNANVAMLLLMNPAGKNALHFPDLLREAAKVFGLRGRKLALCLNEELTEGEEHASSLHTLNTKTLFVKVLPTTAEA